MKSNELNMRHKSENDSNWWATQLTGHPVSPIFMNASSLHTSISVRTLILDESSGLGNSREEKKTWKIKTDTIAL